MSYLPLHSPLFLPVHHTIINLSFLYINNFILYSLTLTNFMHLFIEKSIHNLHEFVHFQHPSTLPLDSRPTFLFRQKQQTNSPSSSHISMKFSIRQHDNYDPIVFHLFWQVCLLHLNCSTPSSPSPSLKMFLSILSTSFSPFQG